MNTQLLLLLAAVYVGLLFYVAWRAEAWRNLSRNGQAIVYSLSLAVYCSSWTFFGAVGGAVERGWHFFTIYLGPILVFTVGWPFLHRLLVMSSRNKVTSIADFIGSRYGKSQQLAAFVTVVAVLGSLPYIALQLKAVTLAWQAVNQSDSDLFANSASGISFIAALLMAWFAIMFGTRVLDGPRRHTGMITAIALESVVKLVAFAAVAFISLQWLLNHSDEFVVPAVMSSADSIDGRFFTQLFLAMAATVCLPRQFHVMAVEHHSSRDSRMARWLFPLYLGLFSLMILPVALAGQQMFSGSETHGDSFVLLIPMAEQNPLLTALAFIGGLSAAAGMVAVAAVTLSVMISNELVVPIWLKFSASTDKDITNIGSKLRLVRRISIVSLMLLGWLLEEQLRHFNGLASIGLIAFAAAAQTLPALVSALYWQRGHRHGVLLGLFVGIAVWCYCLLIPLILSPTDTLLIAGPWGVSWLSPLNLFGTGFLEPLTHGVLWSLVLNTLCFVTLSRRSRFSPLDIRQANAFTRLKNKFRYGTRDFEPTQIEVRQLQGMLQPLLGNIRDLELWQDFEQRLGHRLLPHDPAPKFVVRAVEENLASIIGAVSAHRAIALLHRQKPLQLDDFVSLVGGSSQQLQFSQQLLQTTLETIPQGISVVDADLKLVAWNHRYESMFDYPERLLYIGCPIAKVYQFNAERGYFGEKVDIDATVERRVSILREAKAYRLERRILTGHMIEVCGTPMSNGGYVTTYTDITDYHTVLNELAQSRDQLEFRVKARTAELSSANDSLLRENNIRARVETELNTVHESKSRFLAAASHDLLQPVNAARLFVASLQEKVGAGQYQAVNSDVVHIDGALTSVENLISSLREIARLDSGKIDPRREHFPIARLLEPLTGQFLALAGDNALQMRSVGSSAWVYTDPQMLRRILQNFLSNALLYTRRGKVLLGCRRINGYLVIEVWDTGAGIADKDRQRIFDEFERLGAQRGDHSQGLGLGLSIASRMAQLLGHELDFDSELGRGSVFRITVPLGQVGVENKIVKKAEAELTGLHVLCVDNEPIILEGMRSLLEQWGCQVICAPSLREAMLRCSKGRAPDVVLADYHLDEETGVDVLQALSLHWQRPIKAVVISADNSDELRRTISEAGYLFLAKPVKPASLRASLRRLSR